MKYPCALAAVLLALTGPASATEYLTNGGFETGYLGAWDLEDIPSAEDRFVASGNGFLGLNYGAQSGDWYFVSAVSTQTLALCLRRSLTLRTSS
jgi:hypothetical protein